MRIGDDFPWFRLVMQLRRRVSADKEIREPQSLIAEFSDVLDPHGGRDAV